MNDYTVTLHVFNPHPLSGELIPHSFVTLQAPDRAPLVIGYYPKVTGMSGSGTIRNDAITGNDNAKYATQHPSDFSKTFTVGPAQFTNMLAFADKTANNPGTYQLIGEVSKANWLTVNGYQCTGFAREILSEGDIHPERWRTSISGTIRAVPAMLAEEYRYIPENQIKPYRSTPTDKQINDQIESIKSGIKQHDPKDPNYQKIQHRPNGAPPTALEHLENSIKNFYKPFADAGSLGDLDYSQLANQLAINTHVSPPGAYENTFTEGANGMSYYREFKEDGTSIVSVFNSDMVSIRQQHLDVNGIDVTPPSPYANNSPQRDISQPSMSISFG
jgi:hypothetical protein